MQALGESLLTFRFKTFASLASQWRINGKKEVQGSAIVEREGHSQSWILLQQKLMQVTDIRAYNFIRRSQPAATIL